MQGEELKALRKASGRTQGELAEAIGLTSTYVGMMERGVAPIEPRTAAATRYLLDQFWVGRAKDGRWFVARRTMRELPSDVAMSYLHSELMLYGIFPRRDQAYRWAFALRQSARPRNTRSLLRARQAEQGLRKK